MRKEILKSGANHVAVVFHADRPAYAAPVIDHEFTKGGTRFYKGAAGKDYVADTYDRVFGKRDSKKIVRGAKHSFQRTFKPSR
jgi:hypothetical protein